jgi:glycine/D-amino acid oxidase-like deaminating enzyme
LSGRTSIGTPIQSDASALQGPSASTAVAQQTACLRPVASDGLLVLGGVPGLDQVYVATGGARKGILYGPAMGHALADLVLGRDTRIALDAFAPGRFAGARELPRRASL